MKDVLSQSEIDALISALGTGDVESEEEQVALEEGKEVALYDFRRPSKFSKEQLRTLQVIHDNFARTLASFLSAYFRSVIQLNVVSVTQVSYGEFINSLTIPTLMGVLSLSPKMGTAVLETNLQFVFPMLDLLFGGEGRMTDRPRELTEIEQTVMKSVYAKIINNLIYAWQDVCQLEPVIESLETNPQYNQALASNETVVLITISSQMGDNQGFINLCLPFITLEPIIPHLSAQHWFRTASQKAQEEKRSLIYKRIEEVVVELTVFVGETVISVEDFLELQVGDVLPLWSRVGEEFDLYVANSHKYKVQAGTHGKRMAVQVTRWAEEEEEEEGLEEGLEEEEEEGEEVAVESYER